MIYAMVDDYLFIKKLYDETELAKIRQHRTLYERPPEKMTFNGVNGANIFKFFDATEAKVFIAQKRIHGLRKADFHNKQNDWTPDDNMKTIKKSEEYLKKIEENHPEYFI